MICFTSSLTRQLYHILIVCCRNRWARTLRTVCLNTEWAIGIWYSWLKHLYCWWKAVKIWLVIHAYLMCNCTFTWKSELYSLNCCIWETMPVISWLKYRIFSRGLFFIGTPCILRSVSCKDVLFEVPFICLLIYGVRSQTTIFSARCNIYISRLCYNVRIHLSVRLSVMEVHWCIIANLGFNFDPNLPCTPALAVHAGAHCDSPCMRAHCGRGACREGHLVLC